MLKNIILILVIAAIIGSAVLYIHKEKKRGVKCIGCPNGAGCSGNCGHCSGSCGCAGNTDTE
ncbi:MAG: FeoB-associated Cys-rich membrane protein [Oscillospiraceae bacterium]|nr:FeoB-associated Cys-rich membrane protein [Oscillospiraceae bacterium]